MQITVVLDEFRINIHIKLVGQLIQFDLQANYYLNQLLSLPSHHWTKVFVDKCYCSEKEDQSPLPTCFSLGAHDDAFLLWGCTHWELVFHKINAILL